MGSETGTLSYWKPYSKWFHSILCMATLQHIHSGEEGGTHSQNNPDLSWFPIVTSNHTIRNSRNIYIFTKTLFYLLDIYTWANVSLIYKGNNKQLVQNLRQIEEKKLQICWSRSENILIDHLGDTVPYVLKSYNLWRTRTCAS